MTLEPERCYFDIETSCSMEITVAGVYFETGKFVQLVGNDITCKALCDLFSDTVVYTYNGERFDFPVVKKCLGLDVGELVMTHDLMYDCWRNNLRGGLKKVEKKLGIYRATEGMNGYDAVKLWNEYMAGDTNALKLLLKYNMDDVKNLEVLRKRLKVD